MSLNDADIYVKIEVPNQMLDHDTLLCVFLSEEDPGGINFISAFRSQF